MNTSHPTAAIVIIGAEVLSGKVVDENSPFLVRALRARGVEVLEIRTIGDVVDEIADTVRALAKRYTLVFTTGGVGPTHDDVTIEGIARAFSREVVDDPELVRRWHAKLGSRINKSHLKMAAIPLGARVVLDEASFAPVVQVENVFVLPGVPALVRSCFALVESELNGPPFVSRALLLMANESEIAVHLTEVQQSFAGAAIGSYPRFDRGAPYRVKVTVDTRDPVLADAVVQALKQGFADGMLVGEE